MHPIHRLVHLLILALLVTAGSCEITTFSFSSSSATGRIEVTIVFENGGGVHGDYSLLLDGSTVQSARGGGSIAFEGVAEGDHAVRLVGTPPHCTLEGQNPQPVTVRVNDTSTVRFSVRCSSEA